jgi:acyl-CoA hydrolase
MTIEAKISRAFKSSMEIYVDVWIEDRESQERSKVNEGIYTFVAVDKLGKPIAVPQLEPETALEKERYEGALRRKQLSLILSGKMKPADADELRKLFVG